MGCNIKLVFMYIIFFYIGVLGKIVFWMKVWSVMNIMKMIWGNIQMKYSNEIFKWYFLETLKLEKTLNQVLKPLYISPLLPE